MRIYGIDHVKGHDYAIATALTYWVFKCRDRSKSPAMGLGTWTFLESSIQNAAQISTSLEDYIQYLCDRLIVKLRPVVLTEIVQPQQRILRVSADGGEVQELMQDQSMALYSWLDLLKDAEPHGVTEWDVLELCRSRATIVQTLCRFKHTEDKELGKEDPEQYLEVEAVNV